MTGLTITPEMIAMIANFVGLLAGLLRLESRLTKLETVQKLMMDGMVETGVVNRRKGEK